MINFNFTLDETDAENLCGIINDGVVNALSLQLEHWNDESQREWFKDHVKYLKELQAKVESGMKKVP